MYCGDNPIMRVDPSGMAWWEVLVTSLVAVVAIAAIATVTVLSGGSVIPVLVGAGLGGITSFGISVGTQLIANGGQCGELNWKQIAIDTAIGAVMGSFGGSTIGRIGMTIASGTTEFVGSVVSDLVSGQDLNFLDIMKNAIISGSIGLLFGFIGGPGVQYERGLAYKSAKTGLLKAEKNISIGMYSKRGSAGTRALANWRVSKVKIDFSTSKLVIQLFKDFIPDAGYSGLQILWEEIFGV